MAGPEKQTSDCRSILEITIELIVTMLILVHFRWLGEMLWQLVGPLCICHGSLSDVSSIM